MTRQCFLPPLGCVALIIMISFMSANAQETVAARLIIIGDAGKLHNGKNAVVDAVKTFVTPDDSVSSIFFLGDNIYPKGLPDKSDKTYAASAEVLRTILNSFKDHQAKVYVVPGNHDWEKGGGNGWQHIKNEEQFVNDLHQSNTFFIPKGGCPGPEVIELTTNLILIIADTEWWLTSNARPGAGSTCECKTEDEIVTRLKEIVHRNPDKKILFASHHGFRSYGIHGGYYTWKQHIFPLTDFSKYAYLPLPIIGSLYPILRGSIGNVQDLKNSKYQHMISSIESGLSEAKDLTYLAGHDHNLQLIQENYRSYIISGSGTNRDRVKRGKNSLFASDKNGFAEIIFDNKGRETLRFYEVDEKGGVLELFTASISGGH